MVRNTSTKDRLVESIQNVIDKYVRLQMQLELELARDAHQQLRERTRRYVQLGQALERMLKEGKIDQKTVDQYLYEGSRSGERNTPIRRRKGSQNSKRPDEGDDRGIGDQLGI